MHAILHYNTGPVTLIPEGPDLDGRFYLRVVGQSRGSLSRLECSSRSYQEADDLLRAIAFPNGKKNPEADRIRDQIWVTVELPASE